MDVEHIDVIGGEAPEASLERGEELLLRVRGRKTPPLLARVPLRGDRDLAARAELADDGADHRFVAAELIVGGRVEMPHPEIVGRSHEPRHVGVHDAHAHDGELDPRRAERPANDLARGRALRNAGPRPRGRGAEKARGRGGERGRRGEPRERSREKSPARDFRTISIHDSSSSRRAS